MEVAWRRSVRSAFQPALLARLFLVGVLVATGLLKAQRFVEFEGTLAASGLVPPRFIPSGAVAVVLLELATALGLFVWASQRLPVTVARLLFCTFISYHVWRSVMRIPLPCHCFGALFTLPPLQGIVLNVLLLLFTFPLLTDDIPARQAISAPLRLQRD